MIKNDNKNRYKQEVQQYIGAKISKKILLSGDIELKHLIVSSDSKLDIKFITQGDNINGDIFAIFFGDEPVSANIITDIQNSNSNINIFLLSFIKTAHLIDVQGSINLAKDISNSQGHLLEKNIVLQNSQNLRSQKINIKAVPRLDVYSNDVQATHGVSIDRISEDSLFYITSKGLDRDNGQELIIRGYILNILDKFTDIPDTKKTDIQNMILSTIT